MMENTCALLMAYTCAFTAAYTEAFPPAIPAQLTLQSPPPPPLQPLPNPLPPIPSSLPALPLTPPSPRYSYVVDGDGGMNNRLLKIDEEGSVVAATGDVNGSLPGQFNIPHNVVMDDMRRLWVADRANKRVQVRGRVGGRGGVL